LFHQTTSFSSAAAGLAVPIIGKSSETAIEQFLAHRKTLFRIVVSSPSHPARGPPVALMAFKNAPM
jgi:hypothetical protein